MTQTRKKKSSGLVSCLIAVLLLLLGAGVAGAQDATERLVFNGRSFGTYAALGAAVLVSETAPAFLSCDPGSDANELVSQSVPPLVSTGTIVNTAEGHQGPNTSIATTTDRVEAVSLLSGLITAAVVRATSEVVLDGEQFVPGGEVTVADLRILGLPVRIGPGTTVVPVPGIGSLTINEQTSWSTSTGGFSLVNALHLRVELVNPIVGVGTEVVVGSARSRLQLTPAIVRGYAYGALATLGDIFLGPYVIEGLPCEGTNGVVRENFLASLDVPGILSTGTVRSTSQGVLEPEVSAEDVSEIEDLNLLGIVTADLINARTVLSVDGEGNPVIRATGSGFGNLQVAGHPTIDDTVPFNTRVSILGLGDLWLKKAVREPRRLTVFMVELAVLEANVFGLPVGSRIRVGASSTAMD